MKKIADMKTLIVICLGLLLAGYANGQELRTGTEKRQQTKVTEESKLAIRPQDGYWHCDTNEFALLFKVAKNGTVVTNLDTIVSAGLEGCSPGLWEASAITNGQFTATNAAGLIKGQFVSSTVATGTVIVACSSVAGPGNFALKVFRYSGPWIAELKPPKQ